MDPKEVAHVTMSKDQGGGRDGAAPSTRSGAVRR
jgi:hypothetical protein